jgi:hypothetical protein
MSPQLNLFTKIDLFTDVYYMTAKLVLWPSSGFGLGAVGSSLSSVACEAVRCQALFIYSFINSYSVDSSSIRNLPLRIRTYRPDRKLRPLPGMGTSGVTKWVWVRGRNCRGLSGHVIWLQWKRFRAKSSSGE